LFSPRECSPLSTFASFHEESKIVNNTYSEGYKRLTLRESETNEHNEHNEHKDKDALSTLEIAAEINAAKVARAAEEDTASSVGSQDKRSPEGESSKPGAQWVWAGQEGGGRL
jgi:hypothetical protein